MRRHRPPQSARNWLAALALASMTATAVATDLIEAWRAAQQHDLDFAISRAAQQSGEARRSQAGALWRPNVMLSGTAGVAGSDTAVSGAQFSAPGLGTSDGVAFNTSVNRGTLGRWALSASLPLISRERDAQGKQLVLSADVADLEWQEAQQTLMLTTVQRYFDVVLAADALRVLRQQQVAVNSALTETQDRFRLGDVPVTDTHEATARAEAITAQGLALETDLQLKQAAFADATGLQPNSVQWMAPGPNDTRATPASTQTLEFWVAESGARNFVLRMQLAAVEVAAQEAAKSSGALSPSLDLVAQVGRERLSGSGDFGHAANSSGNRMIGLQLSVPLYTGGMRGAREQEALRGVDKARGAGRPHPPASRAANTHGLAGADRRSRSNRGAVTGAGFHPLATRCHPPGPPGRRPHDAGPVERRERCRQRRTDADAVTGRVPDESPAAGSRRRPAR